MNPPRAHRRLLARPSGGVWRAAALRLFLPSRATQRHAAQLVTLLCILLPTPSAFAEGAVLHVWVDGLACPFCAYGLEKKLKPLPGVERVRIDYRQGWVEVTLEEGARLEEAAIRRAIRAAGFTPGAIHRVVLDGADPAPGAGEP